MALKIRLTRQGAKKRPFYRVVVAEASSPRDGRYIERLGTYNPMLPKDHEDRLRLFKDRIQHWLDHGAQPTGRVQRFLAQAEMMAAPAIPNQTKKNQPKAKAQERLREAEARRKEAEEAAAAATADAADGDAAGEEAPAE
jgi:small subunit ribosomal protein S16